MDTEPRRTEDRTEETTSADEEQRLFDTRRYRDLAAVLGRPGPDEPLARWRLRARLAPLRWAPLIDVLDAADALAAAGADDAPDYAARAIRALWAADARRTAEARLEAAERRWPVAPALDLVRRQLAAHEPRATSEVEHTARLAMRRGDLEDARALAEAAAETPGSERAWALSLLVDLTRGARDYAAAAAAFDALESDGPEAFDAPLVATCAALCRWAGGATELAIEALRELQERTRGGRGERATAHAWCGDVLDRLDRDPARRDAGPAWVYAEAVPPPVASADDRGSAAGAVALARFGLDGAPIPPSPDMATLRFHLRGRGLASLRAIATPACVEAALAEGALVIVEEERPTHTAFLVVLGVEPVAGLLLMHDPRRGGAYLTTLAEQRARAALFGGSALFVLGAGSEADARRERLAAREVTHDARLDAIDACDLDAEGRVPPRARVSALAQDAIALAPELPSPHRRHGEAMLEQLRAGQLARGQLERWVAVTRERFPRAEWALQIYAQALEIWGRHHEAGIAWSDARALDAWDHRNALGGARAYQRIGDHVAAERLLRRALSLEPGHARALARLASLRLGAGDLPRAQVLSALAEEIAPDDPHVLNTRATVHEEEDRFEEALVLLRRVTGADARDTATRARLLRRLFHEGAWDEAGPVADAMVRSDPGDPYNWSDLAFVQVGRGDADGAAQAVLDGLARCGPERVLVDEAARVLGTLLDEAGRASFVQALDRALVASPLALMDVAVELTRRRLDEDGIRVALRARELLPRDPNGPWRAAQTLLALPEERAGGGSRIDALLAETIELAGAYPHPRVVLGLRTLARDPDEALALLQGADARRGPVLVWSALSALHAARGEEADRARVEARLAEVGPDALVDAASLLRNVGFAELALDLLGRALASDPAHRGARIEAARTHLREGDAAAAAAALRGAEPLDPHLETLVAIANLEWDAAARVAEEEVHRVTRRSASGAYDGWVMRGRLGGARLALGDVSHAARVRDLAGRHGDALAAMVGVMRRAGLDAAEDAARLAEVAPGAWLTVERGGARW